LYIDPCITQKQLGASEEGKGKLEDHIDLRLAGGWAAVQPLQVGLGGGGLETLHRLLGEDPPVEADQLDNCLLVSDHIQGVELDVDDLEVALLL
jgi:hypothetical protein